jgi:hypothetical protein
MYNNNFFTFDLSLRKLFIFILENAYVFDMSIEIKNTHKMVADIKKGEKNKTTCFMKVPVCFRKPAKIFLPNNQFDYDLSHSMIITTKM